MCKSQFKVCKKIKGREVVSFYCFANVCVCMCMQHLFCLHYGWDEREIWFCHWPWWHFYRRICQASWWSWESAETAVPGPPELQRRPYWGYPQNPGRGTFNDTLLNLTSLLNCHQRNRRKRDRSFLVSSLSTPLWLAGFEWAPRWRPTHFLRERENVQPCWSPGASGTCCTSAHRPGQSCSIWFVMHVFWIYKRFILSMTRLWIWFTSADSNV